MFMRLLDVLWSVVDDLPRVMRILPVLPVMGRTEGILRGSMVDVIFRGYRVVRIFRRVVRDWIFGFRMNRIFGFTVHHVLVFGMVLRLVLVLGVVLRLGLVFGMILRLMMYWILCFVIVQVLGSVVARVLVTIVVDWIFRCVGRVAGHGVMI